MKVVWDQFNYRLVQHVLLVMLVKLVLFVQLFFFASRTNLTN